MVLKPGSYGSRLKRLKPQTKQQGSHHRIGIGSEQVVHDACVLQSHYLCVESSLRMFNLIAERQWHCEGVAIRPRTIRPLRDYDQAVLKRALTLRISFVFGPPSVNRVENERQMRH